MVSIYNALKINHLYRILRAISSFLSILIHEFYNSFVHFRWVVNFWDLRGKQNHLVILDSVIDGETMLT